MREDRKKHERIEIKGVLHTSNPNISVHYCIHFISLF